MSIVEQPQGPVWCLHFANGVCHACEQDLDWSDAILWRAPTGWGVCLAHHDCPPEILDIATTNGVE